VCDDDPASDSTAKLVRSEVPPRIEEALQDVSGEEDHENGPDDEQLRRKAKRKADDDNNDVQAEPEAKRQEEQ